MYGVLPGDIQGDSIGPYVPPQMLGSLRRSSLFCSRRKSCDCRCAQTAFNFLETVLNLDATLECWPRVVGLKSMGFSLQHFVTAFGV